MLFKIPGPVCTVAMSDSSRQGARSALDNEGLLQKVKDVTNGRKFSMLFESGHDLATARESYEKSRFALLSLINDLERWARHETERFWGLLKRTALCPSQSTGCRESIQDFLCSGWSLLGTESSNANSAADEGR